MNKKIIFFILILLLLSYPLYLILSKRNPSQQNSIQNGAPSEPLIILENSGFSLPVANFKERITKKTFGLYVTPQNSLVQPERFTGYHAAVDVEYQDITPDVPVFALADSNVVYSEIVSGYGGVFVLNLQLDGVGHSALYGHIRPTSLPSIGETFKKGEEIALLGTGYTFETDGERRHLHFAVLSDDRIDLKGYVQLEAELSGWIDPSTLY